MANLEQGDADRPTDSRPGSDPGTRRNAGAKFGFAVNNRKLNESTQQWEEIPVFIDMEIWNRGESKQADRVLQTLRKGQQVFIEGHLKLDTWDDKNGGGRAIGLRVVRHSSISNHDRMAAEAWVTPRCEPLVRPPLRQGGRPCGAELCPLEQLRR